MQRLTTALTRMMQPKRAALGFAFAALFAAITASAPMAMAEEGETPVERTYVTAPAAPRNQPGASFEEQRASVQAKSEGCFSCHVRTDEPSMHASPAVQLGCVDCHGGDASVRGDPSLGYAHADNMAALTRAHVLPRYPRSWNWPSSANPQRSYALLNREAPEFIRFVNPADYRIARESCGACHLEIIENAERSIMATGAMLWGGASYNNGIVPFKNYVMGEAFTREGDPACIVSPSTILPRDQWARACTDVTMTADAILTPEEQARGALARMYPLPNWTVIPPGDVFRVFERGGRNINPVFPEIGLPNPLGQIQRLDEPGRPDIRQSNRGPGTGLRVAIPVLNIHKTRLNDPFMWHMGTNDQPGDYRQSGCSGCHVIYANDREPRHSSVYAEYGRDGETQSIDPTINQLMHRPGGAHGEEEHGDDHAAAPRHPAPPSAADIAAMAPSATEAGHGSLRPAGAPERREAGHPIRHAFTRAIPTAQCMNCHMHQPNIFLNSYLGYTMWDYESDAPSMWPGPENRTPRPEGMSDADYQRLYREQRYPTASEVRATNERNPEAAAARGLWSDVEFLRDVYSLNGQLRDTQFADYHGHGWNFRAVLKRDREGNLLDAEGNMATYGTDTDNIVANDDPERWRRAGEPEFVQPGTNPGRTVHMMDIHAEKGLQCADCHFSQDSHGNGFIYGEVANAVEIGCKDCHGTADAYPTLLTSGPAAPPSGNNLAILRNPDGKRRFEWLERDGRRVLVQRAISNPDLEWEVSLVRDTVSRGNIHFNPRAARAKLMGHADAEGNLPWGEGVAAEDRAHGDDSMACFTCHLSWTTSCGGCHLPIEANWETSEHHFDGRSSRNFATYNPQVARDEMFQLGRHQTTKGNIIAPVRSTSALVLSSTNINRERIYVQQPPVSAIGFSSQAFAPHFPHTVRTQETKTCSDCHLSAADDNNAVMSQLLLLGTNFVNFVGLNNWSGLEGGFQATRVTEWDEPQTVIGSYLHRYAWPDYYRQHVDRNGRELVNWVRGAPIQGDLSAEARPPEEFANVVQGTRGAVRCLQLRGEYMFVAEGDGGFAVYDVAQIGNKGYSERIVSAPFSPLGHNPRVRSRNATCMALATNQPINPLRNTEVMRTINQEQAFHPIYNYAVVTDSEEGLILVNVNTFADGELRNNNLRRAATWNPDGVLNGASHVTLAGHYAYITAAQGLVVVDLDNPLEPRLAAVRPLTGAKASTQQFRYLWVTDAEGVKLFDITTMGDPQAVPAGTIALPSAQKMYVARTYLYIAAKDQGLVIVNVTRPETPRELMRYTAGGMLTDAEDVIVATTNASLFAYVADGRNGVKVLQLTSPESQPNFYGFSPAPVPELIAFARTPTPSLSMSKGIDRDRAVDETGGQMAVFGRLGSRPFNRAEMERLFRTRAGGMLYKVRDEVDMTMWRGTSAMGGDR